MRTIRTVVGLAGLALAVPGLLSGCANSYGVELNNQTGQTVSVTYLDVASDGTTRAYSSSVLARGGTLTNQVEDGSHGFGKRVRLSLPGRDADDQSGNVELKLSDTAVRVYDLKLINGRLIAQEQTRSKTIDKRRSERD